MDNFYSSGIGLKFLLLIISLSANISLVQADDPPNVNFGDDAGYFYNCSYTDATPTFVFTLNNLTSDTEKNRITNYEVNWGDGSIENYTNDDFPTIHAYGQGEFDLQITVTYDQGLQFAETYIVYNTKPDCSTIKISGNNDCAPQEFVFELQGYEDNPPGTYYLWDFGDGTLKVWTKDDIVANSARISHIYTKTSCRLNEEIPQYKFTAGAQAILPCGGREVEGSGTFYSPVRIYHAPDPKYSFVNSEGGLLNAQNNFTGCVNSTQFPTSNQTDWGHFGITCDTESNTWNWTVLKLVDGVEELADSEDYLFLDGDAQALNPSYMFRNIGEYFIRLTASNPCNEDTPAVYQSGKITIYDINSIVYTDYTPKQFCLRDEPVVVFTNNDPEEGDLAETTYEWNVLWKNESGVLVGAQEGDDYEYVEGTSNTSKSTRYLFHRAGRFVVTLVKKNICGESPILEFPIDVYDRPQATILDSDGVNGNGRCGSYTYTPQAEYIDNGVETFGFSANTIVEYLWTFSDNGVVTTSNLAEPAAVQFSNIGPASVTLKVRNDSCGWSELDRMDFEIWEVPTASFTRTEEVCEQVPVNYQGLPNGMAEYSWRFGDGNTSAVQNPQHTFTTPGEKNDRLIVVSSNGCRDTIEQSISVKAWPDVNAGPDAVICNEDAKYSITGASASDYLSLQWSTEGDGTWSGATTLTPEYFPGPGDILSGEVYLQLTATGNSPCGVAVDQMTLSITQAPVIQLGTQTDNICEGSSYQVTGTDVENHQSLFWSSAQGGVFSNSSVLNPVFTPPTGFTGEIELVLRAEAFGVCTDAQDTLTLSVHESPQVDAGENRNICEGETLNLSASALQTSSVLWTSSGDGSFNNAALLNAEYTPGNNDISSGSVQLTLTGAGIVPCGDASDSMLLTIQKKPIVEAGDDQKMCKTETFFQVETGVGQGKAYAQDYASLEWSSSGSGSFNDPGSINVVYTPSSTDLDQGFVILTLTVTSIGPCVGEVADSMRLDFIPEPTVDAGEDATLCEGEALNLSANVTDYTSVLWTSSGSGSFDDPTAFSAVYTPGVGESGNIRLTLTAAPLTPCSQVSDDLMITYVPHPVAHAGADNEVCENAVFEIPAGGGAGEASVFSAASLLWQSSGDGVFDDPQRIDAFYTPGSSDRELGSVTLSLQANAKSPCTGSHTDEMVLTITPEPKANAGSDQAICQGDAITINSATAEDYNSVQWSTSSVLGGYFEGINTLTPTYYPGDGETGEITLTLKVFGNGSCSSVSDAMTLSITPAPISEAGADARICEEGTHTISGASVDHESGFIWVSTGVGTLSGENLLTPSYTAAPGESGDVFLKLIVQGNGSCEAVVDSMRLSIISPPSVDLGADSEVCSNEVYSMNVGEGPDQVKAASYSSLQYSSGGDGVFTEVDGLEANYVPGEEDKANGSVIISLRANSIDPPCFGFATDQMTLIITPEPVVNAGVDESVCEGQSFALNSTSASEYSLLEWSSLAGGSFDDPNILNPVYTPEAGTTGLVNLVLTAQGNGSCKSAMDVLDLTIVPLPRVEVGPDITICENKTLELSQVVASSYSAVNWVSSGSGSFDNPGNLNAVYSPGEDDLANGSVQLTVTVEGVAPCSVSSQDSFTLFFTPPPIVEAGQRDTICQATESYSLQVKSESYPLGADTSNVASISWTTNGKGELLGRSTLTPIYYPTSNEVGEIAFLLSGYGNANCDVVVDTMLLTILPTPSPDFSIGLSCEKNPVQFSDESSGEGYQLTQWEWDFGDGGNASDRNPSHQYEAFGTYEVQMRVSNFFGCSATQKKNLVVEPLPTVEFLHDGIVAKGREVPFGNSTQNGNRYHWTFGDGGESNLKEPIHTFQNTGFYSIKLVVESLYGCIDSLESEIEVIDLPQVAFTKTEDGCGPLTVNFTNNTQGEHLEYHWDFGNGTESLEADPAPVTYTQGELNDTTYTVTLSVSNVAGTVKTSQEVTVFPFPLPRFEILPKAYGCSPVVREIFNTSRGKSKHYHFDFGDGSQYEYDAPNVERPFEHTYTTGDEKRIFRIVLTASNTCGERSIAKDLTVYPNSAVAVFRPSVTEGCVPLTVEFENLSEGAGDYLQSDWIFEPGLSPEREDGNSGMSHTFEKAGTYEVKLMVHDTCAYDTTYRTIVVHEAPGLEFGITARGYCQKEAIGFSIPLEDARNFNNIKWDFGDGNTSELTNPSHTYQEDGDFRVLLTATDVAHGCSQSREQFLSIRKKPVANFQVSAAEGCEPFQVDFVNTSQGASFYSWDFGDGAGSSQENIVHTFNRGKSKVSLVSESDFGCLDTAFLEIIARPTPVADFELDSTIGCHVPYVVDFENKSEEKSSNTYQWSFGNGNVSNRVDPLGEEYADYGNFRIQMIAFNQYLCSDTIIRQLDIYPTPEIGFELKSTALCEGEEVKFKDTSAYRQRTYWYFGDGTENEGEQVSHFFESSGRYHLGIKVEGEGGCADSLFLEDYLNVYPNPVAKFGFENINTPPEGITLENLAETPNNGYVQFSNHSEVGQRLDWIEDNSMSYYWDFRDQTQSAEQHPLHRFSNNGSYLVKLLTTSAYGCTDSITEEVEVNLMSGLFIPSAFSPGNSSEQVSRFIPKGIGLHDYRIEIYDTWGNLLWESEELEEGRPSEYWDGYYKGQLMPQGTYIWRARGTFLNGAIWKGMKIGGSYYRQGTVNLIR
ncbi:MAG: PKD domain-containing protein [Marinifilaceae bacterium]